MKYLAALIILLLLVNSKLKAQWVKCNGPNFVTSFASSGTNLFAGTYSDGVYLSTNNGTSWTAVNNGLTISKVSAFAVSGTNLFASTSGDGVYLSTNNGTHWTAVNNGLTNTWVYALAVKGTNLFAGTQGGVFLSINNGASWASVDNGLTNSNVSAFAVSGTNLFAEIFTGLGYNVYLSTNNGTSWTDVNNGLSNPQVYAFAVNGINLFAGTKGGGVYLSTNNGASWASVNNGLPASSSVAALAVSGTNLFAVAYINTSYGVYLSTNNGTNWTSVSDGLTAPIIINTLIGSRTNLLVGTNAAVWIRPLSDFPTDVSKEVNELPKDFALSQNYPNPFNPSTVISYSLSSSSNIKLIVYNTLGQTIKTLESGYKPAGNYSINFNASDLPSSIYFYKLEAGSFTQIKKMMLIK
jgi:hypothetical protein